MDKITTLLPDRHPNKDFFIVDVSDASPRDEIASMEHPIYSLAMRPDRRNLRYEHITATGKKVIIEVVPSGEGLATIMDKDIILYCISKLVHMKNTGHEISPWVEMTAHEVMVGCNWNTGKRDYQRFEAALDRLRGTTIKTNIKTGDQTVTRGFGLIDEYETWRIDENGEKGPFGRMSKVLVKLSDWTFRAVQSMEVLTIHAGYFRLRRPLERRFYEIARKHVGERNDPFRIGIDKLRNKVGTSMSLKHFRAEVKKIVAAGNIPQYGFMLIKDIITMQRLEQLSTNRSSQTLRTLRTDTRSKALAIASQIATSLISLEREWNSWVDKRNIKIESNDAHFMAFCQVKLQENSAYTPAISRNNGAQGVLALGDTEE